MPLSRFALLCVCALFIVSCSKNYNTDDRRAMSIITLAVSFDTTSEQAPIKPSIKAGTPFYVTDKHIDFWGNDLVQVIWDGDSTGYLNMAEILVGGRYAIAIGTNAEKGIPIYHDEQLTKPYDDPLPERWTLVAAAKRSDKATEILFDAGYGDVLKGFISNELVVTDQKEIDFYNLFMNFFWQAKGDSIVALPEYATYQLLPIAAMAAAEDMNAEIDEEYYDGDFDNEEFERVIAETGWMRDGTPTNETGGVVKKFFVFDDGSEAPAEGYTLENGYPWKSEGTAGQQDLIEKSVNKLRIEITPAKSGLVRFDVLSYYSTGSEFNESFFEEIPDAQAGKAYSVLVSERGDNSMILCSGIRVTITTGGLQRASTMSGSCGD